MADAISASLAVGNFFSTTPVAGLVTWYSTVMGLLFATCHAWGSTLTHGSARRQQTPGPFQLAAA
jgi:hypothetical protein